jgi:hypothetical protein
LLSHLSHEKTQTKDEEILSGMFTAVQEFIKDSFSTPGKSGNGVENHVLREMKIGDNNNILIERGKYAYLAVIFSGRGANKLRNKVKTILHLIETKYERPFKTWVGDMDRIAGVNELLQPLIPDGAVPGAIKDQQLGRVSPPEPMPALPASIPTATKPITPIKLAGVTTITPKPVTITPKPTPARPAMAATPAKVAATPVPAMAAAKPAVSTGGFAKCPKCTAVTQKFPDGSMLCSKCGYTGK